MPLPVRIPGATWPTGPTEITAGDVPPLPIVEKLQELRVSPSGDSMPGLSQTNRLYTPPTGSKTETMLLFDTTGTTLNEQIGFTARTLLASNWTPQFAWIETIGDYIAPWTIGMVRQVPSGTQNAKASWAPPPGVTQPTVVSACQLIITLTEDFLMPTDGQLLKLPTVPS